MRERERERERDMEMEMREEEPISDSLDLTTVLISDFSTVVKTHQIFFFWLE